MYVGSVGIGHPLFVKKKIIKKELRHKSMDHSNSSNTSNTSNSSNTTKAQ
jgi:hypothetical protein